jgi:DNA repair exonuclease SbcCD ATPase subunit
MKGSNMSELVKKLEAAEALAKERADLCETLKASAELAGSELTAVKAQLEAEKATAQSAVAKAAEFEKAIEAHKADLTAARAEVETLKAKLALAPDSDLGAGDKKPLGAGAAGEAQADHKAVYAKISDPLARAKYRDEFGKYL